MKSKKILLFIIALIGSFIINIKGVFALNIDVKDVKLNKKGGNISLGDISFSDKNINSSIVFNDLNDYVIYQITLKNNDKEDYTIDSIKDNNDNENIDITYSYDNKKISSKGTQNLYVTLKYNKKLYNKDSISLNDLTITLNLIDSKGNSGSATINPTTGDNIKKYTLLFIASLILILFGLLLIKRRKSKGFLILLLVLIPTIVIAKESLSFSIKFTNITIKGEMLPYTVTIMDSNGNPTERTVLYGNPIGELPEATKDGYTFDKYEDQDGNKVTKDTVVKDNLTVTPKFNIVTYDIEYDYSGGFATNPIHYTVEDDITLSKPIRLGYTFLGWTGTNINEVQNSVRIQNSTGNLSFVAHWSTNQNTPYKVIHRYPNLDGTYEDVVQNLEGPTDEEVTVALLDRYGFRGPQQLSKVKIVAVENEEDIPTVTYTYTRENYRLTINNDVQTTFTNTSYPYQTEITLTAKDKENYEFTGWTNGSTTKTITFNLTEDTEILPIYSRIKYTVTYNANGGTINPGTVEVDAGESITTLPLPEAPTGKEFDAWYTGLNDGTKVTSPFTPNSDVEIFARYKNKTFTVSFNTNGGSNVASQTIEYGSKVTRPTTDPTKTNYAFVNWYTNDSYNTLFDFDNTTITSNTTIYAKFKTDLFPTVFSEPGECTFNGSNGVITGSDCSYANGTNKYIDTGINLYNTTNHAKDYEIGFTIVSYDYSENVNQATFMNTKLEGNSYPGLVFRKNNDGDKKLLDLSSRKTSSANQRKTYNYTEGMKVKIYRIYNETLDTQEIFYSINDEEKIKLNDLSEFNPTFNLSVWFGATPTDASATSAQRYLVGTMKDMYIKLGTYIEDDTEKYTITFNANGGTVSPTRKNITVGQAVGTLPTPTAPTGKSFIGWYTGLNDGEEVTSSYIPNTNKTIYARYYTNVSGATVAPSSINVLMDASETITVSNVEEEYTFTSNNTNIATVDSTGKVTGKGVGSTTITITGTSSGKAKTVNVTVESSTYTVTLNPNGGTLTTTSITKDKGVAVGTLPTPTAPEGKEFDGWYTDLTGGEKVTSSFMPNVDKTIYARYINSCNGFATDSWSTIKTNLENNSSYYAVGCEKEVELDMNDDGTNESYTVRLANTSTPEVCNTEGYSQTACGTVIDFVDVVGIHNMNSTGPNSGGWKESDLVTYLNSEFYNKLPTEIKNIIIPTYPIVSGSGSENDSTNITNLDTAKNKIYLLSTREIDDAHPYDNKTNLLTDTRIIDFYEGITDDRSKRVKKDLSGNTWRWWLRTAYHDGTYGFFSVSGIHTAAYESSTMNIGVAPAFRIGKNTYTVEFNANGGSVTNPTKEVIKGSTIGTLPTPTAPTGKEFDGWYTELNGGTKVTSLYQINADTTLYARYINSCNGFATDSWSTIKTNLENNSDYYAIGCEKEVELDMNDDGTNESYTVRLANTSTPTVCSTEGYSKTACGNVIEFVDVVKMDSMNSTNTNVGGWKSTEMATYLNGDFYSKLPSDLKSVIIPTYPIVSGSGSENDSANITNLDTARNKIYLLSLREAGVEYFFDNKNNINTDTRTLDFYTNNSDKASKIKKDINNVAKIWWTRSASFENTLYFLTITANGNNGGAASSTSYGIAPAFRIGTKPSFSVTFNTDGGSSVASQTITYGNKVTKPTTDPTKSGYTFDNWYTDDTYQTVFDFDNTVITSATTIYANWEVLKTCADNENITNLSSTTCSANENITVGDGIVCKRAIKLHEELCSQTNGTYYCSGAGYTTSGSKGTSTITYGNCGTSGTLSSGDAFTCDVNGDGEYDELTERFYYVSDYYNTSTKTFDTSTVVLIYYNNVTSGVSCNKNSHAYATKSYIQALGNTCTISSGCNWYGPVSLKAQLPTTNQWSNVSLKNTSRAILAEWKTTSASPKTSGGTLPTAFDYSRYAARLLTAKELMSTCNLSQVGNLTTGELDGCNYLMENTRYAKSSLGSSGYWLENPFSLYYSSSGSYASGSDTLIDDINVYYRRISNDAAGMGSNGVRPVIEVPKTKISY